jgi:hypothetical protein
MSFVMPGPEPPAVKENEILKAKITGISKGTSKWKDQNGNPREQLEFSLEFQGGYKCKSWIAFYQKPSDKSKMGKLALRLQEATKTELKNADDFLETLKEYRQVFVKCKGFREYEGELYPNFSIVADKLPLAEQPEKTEKLEQQKFDAKKLLTPFKDAIANNFPLNEDDFNQGLSVQERIFLFNEGYIEKRTDLYFWTARAMTLFQKPQKTSV